MRATIMAALATVVAMHAEEERPFLPDSVRASASGRRCASGWHRAASAPRLRQGRRGHAGAARGRGARQAERVAGADVPERRPIRGAPSATRAARLDELVVPKRRVPPKKRPRSVEDGDRTAATARPVIARREQEGDALAPALTPRAPAPGLQQQLRRAALPSRHYAERLFVLYKLSLSCHCRAAPHRRRRSSPEPGEECATATESGRYVGAVDAQRRAQACPRVQPHPLISTCFPELCGGRGQRARRPLAPRAPDACAYTEFSHLRGSAGGPRSQRGPFRN